MRSSWPLFIGFALLFFPQASHAWVNPGFETADLSGWNIALTGSGTGGYLGYAVTVTAGAAPHTQGTVCVAPSVCLDQVHSGGFATEINSGAGDPNHADSVLIEQSDIVPAAGGSQCLSFWFAAVLEGHHYLLNNRDGTDGYVLFEALVGGTVIYSQQYSWYTTQSQLVDDGADPYGLPENGPTIGSGDPMAWRHLPWTQYYFNFSAYAGQTVTVRFTAANCDAGAHNAIGFVDDVSWIDCSLVPTPTVTPVFSPTPSWTESLTSTPSFTASPSPSATSTPTLSDSPTETLSSTPTPTATPTDTATTSGTPSPTPTGTPTVTLSATPSSSATATPSQTPLATRTATLTATATATVTVSATPSSSATATSSQTPLATRTMTPTATTTASATASASSTGSPSPSATFTGTITLTMIATRTATAPATASRTVTATNTASRTIMPSVTPSRSGTATGSATPTLTVSATRTQTASVSPSPTRTPSRTVTRTVTSTRTATPSATGSGTASPAIPSATLTPTPAWTRTPAPSVFVECLVFNSAGERVRAVASDVALYAMPLGVTLQAQAFIAGAGRCILLLNGGNGASLAWDGLNDQGQLVATGTYNLQLVFRDPWGRVETFNTQVLALREAAPLQVQIFNSAGELVRHITSNSRPDFGTELTIDGDAVVPPSEPIDPNATLPGKGVRVGFGGSGGGLTWDCRNDRGEIVASGNYLIQAVLELPGREPAKFSKDVTVLNVDSPLMLADAILVPNPLKMRGGSLQILWPATPLPPTDVRAQVYALNGELVATAQPDALGHLAWTPRADLSSGLYLIEITARDASGKRQRKLLKAALVY